MKKETPHKILNEILLRMKYDSSMTLSENKLLISEQPPMQSVPKFNLDDYYYDANGNRKKKDNIVQALPKGAQTARSKYPNAKTLNDLPTSTIVPLSTFIPPSKEFDKTVSNFLNKPQSGFVGPPKPTPIFVKPEIPQSDVLGPQGWYIRSLGIDKRSLEIANKLKPLKEIPSDISSLYKWFLEFRSIWQSTSMQVMQTAIGVAFGSVTEGVGFLAVQIIDWGVDVLILLIDFLYAINDPNSDEKWNRVKESAYTVALFGAIGASFKGAKNASQWIRKNVKQIEGLIQTVKKWLINFLKKFGNIGKPITEPIKKVVEYINKKLSQLLGTAIAGYVSVFFLNALPVAGAMVAILKINEEKISQIVSPILNSTIGLGIDELRLIAGGPDLWQEKGKTPTSEQFGLASKIVPEKDTTQIVNLGKATDEEVKNLQGPTTDVVVNKGHELMSELKEESMKIANENTNQYMEEVLKIIDSPCNEYLKNEYKKGNAKYLLSGERGTVLMINNTPAALTYGNPDSIQINGKDVCV